MVDDFDDKQLGELVLMLEHANRAPVDPTRAEEMRWRIEVLVQARLDTITERDYERVKRYLKT